jgi:hypothetical protein
MHASNLKEFSCQRIKKPITVTSKHFGMDCEDHCANALLLGPRKRA